VLPADHRRRRSQPAAAAATDAACSSVEQVRAAYFLNGWLCLRTLLSSSELAALHAAVDALELEAASLVHSQRIDGVYYEVQSASGRKGEPAVSPGALRKVTGPSRRCTAFASLRQHPALFRAATELCGVPAPRCVVDQANFKPARTGTGFPWHQDASFVFGDAKTKLKRYGGVNVVVALDSSDEHNGGFEVLSGTHTGSLVDLHGVYDGGGSNDELFDLAGRTLPRLAPGDALLFHPLLAHGSGPNLSDRRRRLATLWFVGSGT
jgi:ectoine hydroxylase-related dioxygenase (phytanoyl-CoA dioxygenase family)